MTGGRRRALWRAEEWPYVLMLAPAVLALLLMVFVPLGYLVYTSLLDWKLADPAGLAFVGAANYFRMARDPDFWHAVQVTAVFIGGSVAMQIGLGLVLVEALPAVRWGSTLVRTFLLLPMGIPPLVVGLIWRILYDPTTGNTGLDRVTFTVSK